MKEFSKDLLGKKLAIIIHLVFQHVTWDGYFLQNPSFISTITYSLKTHKKFIFLSSF